MDTHKKAFAEIKNYYNDITHNNLDLIKSLKEEVEEMRKKEHLDEKQMQHISQVSVRGDACRLDLALNSPSPVRVRRPGPTTQRDPAGEHTDERAVPPGETGCREFAG